MLTDPIPVWRVALATPTTRGLLVNKLRMLLLSWPALGLAGFGALVHATGGAAYVTQATATNVPVEGPADLKRFVTRASGVTFAVDDVWDGRDDKVFGIFSEDDGGVVREWPLVPEIAGRVTGLATTGGGQIEVRWSSWRPGDPRCCPSLTHESAFILRDGQAVAVTTK